MKIAADELFAIEALPERGLIVVVQSAEIRAQVQRSIVDRYGSEVAGRTKVVVIRDFGDIDKIMGVKRQVLLDPGFAGAVRDQTLSKVLALARSANAIFRK